ncbi:MAG: ABC transporter substrate-binding protein [Clostridiales bacterium]|nr:ABC transporter substrate-binding protein [Clostridiales bacterium]
MKKLRKFVSLLLAAAMLFVLTGCVGSVSASLAATASSSASEEASASSGGDLPADPDAELTEEASEPEEQPFTLGCYTGVSFNPYYCDNTANQAIISLLFDPLVELDESFTVQPCLATSVTCKVSSASEEEDEEDADASDAEGEEDKDGADTSDTGDGEEGDGEEDGKDDKDEEKKTYATVTTVTVKLRTDVTFKDGTKLDADDVVYSLNQARSEDSIYYTRLSRVKSVKAEDSSTVVVKVNGSNASFDRLLDIPIVKEGTGGEDLPTGTGAYRLRYDGDTPSYLEANDSWWRAEALPLETIPLYAAEDSDALLYGFGSGAVSLVSTDLTGTSTLSYNGNFQVADYATTVMLFLGCNTKQGACATQKVRSAIYYALDRDTLVSKMLSGHGEATSLPISPSAADYDDALAETLSQDREKAAELLDGSYTGAELTLIVNSDSSFKVSIAQEIADELEGLGMDVTVKALSWSDFKAAVADGDYDLYLGEVQLTADFSLDAFLEADGSQNPLGYADDDLTDLYTAFCKSSGEARQTAAEALYTELADQAPFIPICFKCYSALYQWNTLTSLTPTQHDLFYQFSGWTFASQTEEQAS